MSLLYNDPFSFFFLEWQKVKVKVKEREQGIVTVVVTAVVYFAVAFSYLLSSL